ncbi:uncharacterized protein LOC130712200 [Lotus japonicus]|uniref:uncharacterized protein LOC130712200 n=1 Tax=Lotus japonicus TaxID=34305 RepID=UPI002583ADAA|nr:uncharacterized protein LOC130712200 [Lotus japonicus]
METRSRRDFLEDLRRRLGFEFLFTVDPRGLSGGLALFWKKEVHIQVLQSNPNFIHTAIHSMINTLGWDCTFVYGDPSPQRRRSLWPRIANLRYRIDIPWCLIGDFNEILHAHEKDGLRPQTHSILQRFQEFVHHSGLMDLDLKGNKFTWHSNQRDGFITREKIDRVLTNWHWRSIFPNASAMAYPQISSDHSPVLLDPSPPTWSITPFKFEVFWEEHEQCQEMVNQGWSNPMTNDNCWQDLSNRIRNSKRTLWTWQKKVFKVADKEIIRLKQHLQQVQEKPHHLVDWSEVSNLKVEIDRLWRQEELFWGQRSRINWARLLLEVSDAEIAEAVNELGGLKAPGPDGLNGLFFKNHWETVKGSVCAAVRDFFLTGNLSSEINETIVALIPKVDSPENVAQFRPISCCNYILKVLSRIMVTRLKEDLSSIISPNQSAFVAGRVIQDNIAVAQEAFHLIQKAGANSNGFMAIKVDMSKAYDRLEWSFLERALKSYGFHPMWIARVMTLVRGATYKLKVNGFLSSSIVPEKGLRQGDPLPLPLCACH